MTTRRAMAACHAPLFTARRLALLAVFFAGGCAAPPRPGASTDEPAAATATGGAPPTRPPTPAADATTGAQPGPDALALSPWAMVGRVLSVDERARTAIVEVVAFTDPVTPGEELLVRSGALRIVARLAALPVRRGRFVAVQLLEGDVRAGDEVVRLR